MLHVHDVLCLVSRAVTGGGGLEYGIYLGERLDAILHTMPVTGRDGPENGSLQHGIEGCVQGKPVETVMLAGADEIGEVLVEKIRRYVAENDIGLVIVDPPPDRGAVPPMADGLMGRLIQEIRCPLFFVETPPVPGTVNEIVVPTDLSEHSHEALAYAANLAELYDASISLLYVVSRSPYVALTDVDRLSMGDTTLSEHRAYRELHRFIGDGRLANAPIEPHLAFGEPADRIAHFIQDRTPDLLVLSSHGRQTRPDEPVGRVADRVLRRVTCPVFFIPAFGCSLLSERSDADDSSDAANGGRATDAP